MNTVIVTSSNELMEASAQPGVGVTLCEPFTAHEYATRGIVVRPFEPRIEFEFAALHTAAQWTSLPAREFIDGFRAHVADFLRRQTCRTRS